MESDQKQGGVRVLSSEGVAVDKPGALPDRCTLCGGAVVVALAVRRPSDLPDVQWSFAQQVPLCEACRDLLVKGDDAALGDRIHMHGQLDFLATSEVIALVRDRLIEVVPIP